MNLVEFLRAVTPSGAKLVAARKVQRVDRDGRPYSTFAHTVVDTHEDLAAALQKAAASGEDAYFALAGFRQGFHRNANGKAVVRVRDNVSALQAFWMDIDYKDGYGSPSAALKAVRAFCDASGVPPPTIVVASGNGLHVYWPLSEPVPVAEWQPLATRLKNLAAQHGLKADGVCTADSCRVLRPPFTTNFKDPTAPKPVRLLSGNGVTRTAEQVVPSATTPFGPAVLGDLPSYVRPGAADADEYTGGTGTAVPKGVMANIIAQCAVMQEIVETKGAHQSEPEWSATLQLLKHCEDGENWVHKVSEGHPDYEHEATERKWQGKLENTSGPTLCETFQQWHSAKCITCPFYGKIKSPVQLESVTPNSPAAKAGVVLTTWRPGADGRSMEMKVYDKETKKYSWQKALSYMIDDVKVVCVAGKLSHGLEFRAHLGNNSSKQVSLPSSTLGNTMKLREEMFRVGVPIDEQETKAFVKLMSTWLKKMQQARQVETLSEQLGWLTDENNQISGFGCANITLNRDGTEKTGVRPTKDFEVLTRHYTPIGDPKDWRAVADMLLKDGSPTATIMLASAFATPLLRFAGLQGSILSFVSAQSGAGKTTAMRAAQAVWGSPTKAVNSVDDTVLSVAKKVGFIQNLPAYWDEVRGEKTIESFKKLAFQITQGKEKSRLDSSSSLREVYDWQTMVVVASNDSIFDAMATVGSGSDAGVLRTFEVTADALECSVEASQQVQRAVATLNQSYGWAGVEYARYLVTHLEQVEQLVEAMQVKVSKDVGALPVERFWVGTMAVLLAGAQLANEAGVCKFDVPRLYKQLRAVLTSMRQRRVSTAASVSPEEIIASFLAFYQSEVLVTDKFRGRGKSGDPRIIRPPNNPSDKITVHRSVEDGHVRFPVKLFNDYSERQFRTSARLIIADMRRRNLHAKTIRGVLGAGTSYALPQMGLIEVDYTSDVDDTDQSTE
jgi:hypothetical protein